MTNEYLHVEAGKCDKQVSIEKSTPTKDAFGQMVDSWATWVANLWASIEPISGREFFAAQQFSSEITHRVKLANYRSGVSTKMRVKYGSRYFRIEHVIDPRERHESLTLLCAEVLA